MGLAKTKIQVVDATTRALKAEAALRIAAEDAYKEEVIETDMKDILIGEGKDYANREEWLEDRLESWSRRVTLARMARQNRRFSGE